ncbi:MAG TPA: peptide-methionine (R)-S-oxide reductase, partial [Oceanospirillaceae bacterium]|nr:peptide-methionine (R)-S-oxide reductase [Oceanospirillaceae bacterium]
MSEQDKKQNFTPLSELEWQQKLSPAAYHVCRQKGTERPYTGQFDQHFEPGVYTCHCCGTELFVSDSKFNAGCGWPSFDAEISAGRVAGIRDV